MDFIYQQIGLNVEGQSRVSAYFIVHQILVSLGGYGDNGPLDVAGPRKLVAVPKFGRGPEINIVLESLAKHNIILYKYEDSDYRDKPTELIRRYRVFVTNRYKLELLRAELKWLGGRKDRSSEAPQVDNLVYYNTNTGEMFFNGLHKTLEKRNKKLLNVLFTASPDYVARKRLLTIAHSESKYASEPGKTVVTEAFTNLRKVCGVNRESISLSSNKGGRLNAFAYPLEAQLPPPDFLTD